MAVPLHGVYFHYTYIVIYNSSWVAQATVCAGHELLCTSCHKISYFWSFYNLINWVAKLCSAHEICHVSCRCSQCSSAWCNHEQHWPRLCPGGGWGIQGLQECHQGPQGVQASMSADWSWARQAHLDGAARWSRCSHSVQNTKVRPLVRSECDNFVTICSLSMCNLFLCQCGRLLSSAWHSLPSLNLDAPSTLHYFLFRFFATV